MIIEERTWKIGEGKSGRKGLHIQGPEFEVKLSAPVCVFSQPVLATQVLVQRQTGKLDLAKVVW